jgi:hypothetical protein
MTNSSIEYADAGAKKRIISWGKQVGFDPETQLVMLLEDKYGIGSITIENVHIETECALLKIKMKGWKESKEFALLANGSLAW